MEDLVFESGLVHTIVGPNGSGKTTLMRLLSFLDRATRGSITFRGHPLEPRRTMSVELRRSVTLVMQDHYLFEGSVYSNMAYGLNVRGVRHSAISQFVESALAAVALTGFGHRRVDTLSGGESKRVAVARALALGPGVLLLDEPTANIDRINTELIEETIANLKSEGLTTIMTTHDFGQAYRLGDSMTSLVAGKVVDVSPENIFPCMLSGKKATIAPGVVVQVPVERSGPAHIAIDPEDVILSLSEFNSSARNCLSGKIMRISIEDALVKVYVDVGTEVSSIITEDSLEKLKLKPGMSIYVTFKATSVRVL